MYGPRLERLPDSVFGGRPVQQRITFVIFVLVVSGVRSLPAAFNYSSIGSTYSQDFDSLASSGTDIQWTNDATIVGWSLYRVAAANDATPVPLTLYDASDGSAESGRFYSFGTGNDRALGGIGSGTFGYPGDQAAPIPINATAGWLTASFTNGTGIELSQFTVGYDGEQWRDAGDNEPPYAQTMELQYGFGTDFSTVSSWNSPGGSFDFTSPVFTTTAGAIDGNGVGRIAGLGGTISSVSWQAGETLWLRWVVKNDSGLDHAMAIDNFSLNAAAAVSAVPEAGALLTVGLVGLFAVIAACAGKRLGINLLQD
jgi:hypothetical protein